MAYLMIGTWRISVEGVDRIVHAARGRWRLADPRVFMLLRTTSCSRVQASAWQRRLRTSDSRGIERIGFVGSSSLLILMLLALEEESHVRGS